MVLLLNVVTAALIYIPILCFNWEIFEQVDGVGHIRLFAKSALVGASWTCALFALKHLPLSIASPIRASSPVWTILIAVGALGERPNGWQWVGILLVLLAFGFFTRIGKREENHINQNRWLILMVIATLLGSVSALYDKYLLQTCGYQPVTVQAWFSIYLCPVMLPLAIYWYKKDRKNQPFQFRWTIPAIAITLLIADYLYFTAISDSSALISVISPVRRTSVMIPFVFGVLMLNEKNGRPKLACLVVMLAGVILLSQST